MVDLRETFYEVHYFQRKFHLHALIFEFVFALCLVLLQLSKFLLPISEVLDRKYFKSYHKLHVNNGGVIFMVIRIIGGTVH